MEIPASEAAELSPCAHRPAHPTILQPDGRFLPIIGSPDIGRTARHALHACHPYWESHYTFGCPSHKNAKALTAGSLNLIAINTVVPLLYAYGQTHGNDKYCERALQFLEPIKAENNYITRQWAECGIKVDNASDSQALIQLKKEYCDRKYCLHCRFGYEFLKRKNTSE